MNSFLAKYGLGLKVFGEKEWMTYKHSARLRRVCRKLHIAVDAQGTILSSTLTTLHERDASQVLPFLEQIPHPIFTLIADGGYYSV